MRAYANKRYWETYKHDVFVHIFRHPKGTIACGDYHKPEPVFEVEVRELREGEQSVYWGWLSFEDNLFHMVYPSRVQAVVCFPYGYEAEEQRGRGKFMNLVVEWTGAMHDEEK